MQKAALAALFHENWSLIPYFHECLQCPPSHRPGHRHGGIWLPVPGNIIHGPLRQGHLGSTGSMGLNSRIGHARHIAGDITPAKKSPRPDRKSTRLNSSHLVISYAVFCLKKKKKTA